VENFCRAGQATKNNMAHAHCMLVAKATDKHTHNFLDNNGCTNAPQCYFIGTLPVLCKSNLTHYSFMKIYPMQYNIVQSYYFSYFFFYFRYVNEALYFRPANYRGGAYLAHNVSTDSSLYRKFLLDCIISAIVGLYPQ
jgi:hypothetical protein